MNVVSLARYESVQVASLSDVPCVELNFMGVVALDVAKNKKIGSKRSR